MILSLWLMQFLYSSAFGVLPGVISKHRPNKDVNGKFGEMLQELVDVNEKRINKLKELTRLDDYSFGLFPNIDKNRLRSRTLKEILGGKGAAEDAQDFSPNIAVILRDRKSQNSNKVLGINKALAPYKMAQRNTDVKTDTCDFSNMDEESMPIARSLKKKISEKGSIYCKKACKDTLITACLKYKCKSKLKDAIKKECKRTCKEYFNKHTHHTHSSDSDTC